jgi:hypothetical protein
VSGHVVLIVIIAVIALLAIGGAIATARMTRARAGSTRARLREANDALAAAHAQDKGWERAGLEAAARRAFAERHGGRDVRALELVQVVDRPGTEDDQAIFRVRAEDGEHEVVLGRRGDEWVAASAAPRR